MENLKNRIKWAWQRAYRGYDDTLFWSMDEYLSPIIVIGLKHLRENAIGYPTRLKSQKQWNKILDKMIFSFEYDKHEFPLKKQLKDMKKLHEGYALFAEYYQALWD